MKNIITLDCTLRDGGYCNKWRFGNKNIKRIISSLIAAKVEVIECGFLTNRVDYDADVSKFTDLNQLNALIPQHSSDSQFVVMANYGEYDFEKLPEKANSIVDGIRLAFHKGKRYQAIEACKTIKAKGYDVYMQPMVSMLYSDEEFKELISLSNELKPIAFYLVDSFGMMNKKAVNHYFGIMDDMLDPDTMIGFHSHNNLQLAYSNALSFMKPPI